MGRVMANTTFDLCHGGLQEVWKAKCLKKVLGKDKIAYCEMGYIVGNVCSSTSILNTFMNQTGFGADPYMGTIGSSSTQTSWGGDSDLAMSVLGPSISQVKFQMQLYYMT